MSVFDPKFKYRSSLNTDITETFKRVRKEQERAKREADELRKQLEEKVKQIGFRK
jgi:hypothetical protein